jgi:MFS family permease
VSGENRTPSVYDWQTSITFAVVGTVLAVVLILIFTEIVDLVGDFWSQVFYFVAVFGGIIAAAIRSRRKDRQEPARLSATTPITPAGLPGPFVVTQALGVLGLTMIIVGAILGGDAGIIWIFGGFVLALVGGVGLLFWLGGMVADRRG